MPKKSTIPLEYVNKIRLFAGDKERLQNLYPILGYNKAIRNIVRTHLDAAELKLGRETAEL